MKYLIIILLLFTFNSAYSGNTDNERPKNETYITITANHYLKTDTLCLWVFDKNILSPSEVRYIHPQESFAQNKDGKYVFSIDNMENICYVSILKNGNLGRYAEKVILDYYLLSKWDSINISIDDNDKLSFHGKGFEKFKCRQHIENNFKSIELQVLPAQTDRSDNYFMNITNRFSHIRQLIHLQTTILKEYQQLLNPQVFQLLYVDMLGEYQSMVLSKILAPAGNGWLSRTDELAFEKLINDSLFFFKDVKDETLVLSKGYTYFLWNYCMAQYYLKYNTVHATFYSTLKNNSSGIIRDKLLAMYQLSPQVSSDSIIDDALSIINNNLYKDAINEKRKVRAIGKLAPDFNLGDIEGRSISLSDFKGKIVFLDFWYTGCTPCAWYYKDVVSVVEKYFHNSDSVAFLTISDDKDRTVWEKSVNSNRYCSSEATNLFVGELGSSHPVFRDFGITAAPRPLIIDRNGKYFSVQDEELGMAGKNRVQTLIETIQRALRQK